MDVPFSLPFHCSPEESGTFPRRATPPAGYMTWPLRGRRRKDPARRDCCWIEKRGHPSLIKDGCPLFIAFSLLPRRIGDFSETCDTAGWVHDLAAARQAEKRSCAPRLLLDREKGTSIIDQRWMSP